MLTAIEFGNGEARLRGLADQGRELIGPLAGRGYAARVDGDQLVLQTASASAPSPAAMANPRSLP